MPVHIGSAVLITGDTYEKKAKLLAVGRRPTSKGKAAQAPACLWLRASRWLLQASASLDQPRAALTGLCFRHTGGGHWCKQLNGWIFPEAKREQVVAAMGDDVTEEQVVHAPKPSVNANATLLVSRHKKAHLRRVDQATPEPEPEPEPECHPHPTPTPSPTPPPHPCQATLVTGETLKVHTQGQSGLSWAGPELRPAPPAPPRSEPGHSGLGTPRRPAHQGGQPRPTRMASHGLLHGLLAPTASSPRRRRLPGRASPRPWYAA